MQLSKLRQGVLTAAAIAAGTLAAPAAGAGPQSHAHTAAVSAGGLIAKLRVADRAPLQMHGVLLDASGSKGPITSFVFHFGDGTVVQSYQPLALHGYQTPGTYRAFVVVLDGSGHLAVSSRVSIRVRDGLPPVVRINLPRPDQRMHLGSSGLLLSGTVKDNVAVAKVQLAVQLVASRQHFTTHGACIWYDAHQFLLLSACGSPFFFDAQVRHGRWSFRVDPLARIPKGTYVVRVRAIDRAGNISHYYAVSLRTILPFTLV